MAIEEQMRSVAAGDGKGNIIAFGQHRIAQRFELLVAAPLLQPIDHGALARTFVIVHWIHTRPAHEFLSNLEGGHLRERK